MSWRWAFAPKALIPAPGLGHVKSNQCCFQHLWCPKIFTNMQQRHIGIIRFFVKLKPKRRIGGQANLEHAQVLVHVVPKPLHLCQASLENCARCGSQTFSGIKVGNSNAMSLAKLFYFTQLGDCLQTSFKTSQVHLTKGHPGCRIQILFHDLSFSCSMFPMGLAKKRHVHCLFLWKERVETQGQIQESFIKVSLGKICSWGTVVGNLLFLSCNPTSTSTGPASVLSGRLAYVPVAVHI